MTWDWQNVSVGALDATVKAAGQTGFTSASGEGIYLGKGVGAIASLSTKSKIVNNMSPIGQAAVVGGMRAIEQLANGNIAAAGTTAAGVVLAGLSYYTAKSISEGAVDVATATVSELASGISDMVPLLGIYVDMMMQYSGTPGHKSETDVIQECFTETTQVRFGTGKDGSVMPCDIFMAVAFPDSSGAQAPGAGNVYDNDGLHWYGHNPKSGKLAGIAGGSYSALLRSLENNKPFSANAKKAFKGMGLTSEEKKLLSDFRLAISATYQRPGYVRSYMQSNNLPGPYSAASQDTDGGYSLWPFYVDILWQAWRQGRLPNQYIIWEFARTHGGSFKNRSEALASLYANAGGVSKDPNGDNFDDVIALVNSTAFNQNDGGQNDILCATLDRRMSQKFFAMMVGWDQFVDTHYINVPKTNPSDNPLTAGPGGVNIAQLLPTKKGFSPFVLGAAALAGLYYYKPTLVTSSVQSATSFAKRGYSSAVKSVRKVF